MKNNDLSNRACPSILVRLEDFLVEYKDKSVWDKVANFVVGKEKRATLNEEVVHLLRYVFRTTDMTIDLVTDGSIYSESVLKLIGDLPFGRIVEIQKPVQVAIMLNRGDYIYYVDSDLERISLIGHKRCTTLDRIFEQLKGGYKFV